MWFQSDLLKMYRNQDVNGLVHALRRLIPTHLDKHNLDYYGDGYAAWLKRYRNPNVQRLLFATRALEAIGVSAVEPLEHLLRDRDKKVRAYAARLLGNLADPRSVEPLIKLLYDPDVSVQENVVEALCKIGGVATVKPLSAKLNEGAVSAGWSNSIEKIVDALRKIGTPAIQVLIADLGEYGREDNARWYTRLGSPRDNTIRTLKSIGSPAVEQLIIALSDSSESVRAGAAETLARIADARAVAPLLSALHDPSELVRVEIVSAISAITRRYDNSRSPSQKNVLEEFGIDVVETLLGVLEAPSTKERARVIEALGNLRDSRALEPLVNLHSDSDPDIRSHALEALGKIGGARAGESIVTALADSDSGVRKDAAITLANLGDARAVEPLLKQLAETSYDFDRRKIIELLGKLGDARAIEPLIQLLSDSDNVWAVVRDTLTQNPDSRVVESLIFALRDSNKHLREHAAQTLGLLKDPRAVEPLIVRLSDPDKDVRSASIDALGNIGDAGAVDALIQQLRDPDPEICNYTVMALGKIKNARAVEPLIELLYHPGKDTELWSILFALGEIGDSRATQPLIDLWNRHFPPSSKIIVRIGWGFVRTRVFEKIGGLIYDLDRNYKKRSALYGSLGFALGKIADPQAIEFVFSVFGDDNVSYFNGLSIIGTPVVQSFIDALGNPNAQVRAGAASVLADVADPNSVEKLLETMGDPDKNVRRWSAYALGEIGDPRAVKPLMVALTDTVSIVRIASAEALGEIADPRAVEGLVDALDDPDGDVRATAVDALARIGVPAIESLVHADSAPYFPERTGAQSALGKIGTPAVQWTSKYLGETQKKKSGAWWAVRTLAKVGTLSTESLISHLSQNWYVIDALGDLNDVRAVEPLIVLLQDSSPTTRSKAAGALGKIGDPRALSELECLVREDHTQLDSVSVTASATVSNVAQKAVNKIHQRMKISYPSP